MKIQNISNNNFLLTGKHNTGIKTIQESLNQGNTEEKSVQVAISKQGYKSYRNNLSNLEGFTPQEIPEQEDAEPIGKIDINNGRISSELNGLMDEFLSKEPNKTSDGQITSLFKAYTALYDEIKQGYQDGTRDLWAKEFDHTNPSYRQITEEEELAELNEAFSRYSSLLERCETISPEFQKVIDDRKKMVAELSGRQPVSEEEVTQEPVIKPEDIEETLKKGRTQFLAKYAMFQNQTEFSQGVADILSTMFQGSNI